MSMATMHGDEAGAGDAARRPERAAGQPGAEAGLLETCFGPVALDPAQQIRFKGGLPGFPEHEQFQLEVLPSLNSDLFLLQSLDDREVAFIVMPLPESAGIIAREDIAEVSRQLGIAAGDLLMLAIVTIQRNDDGVRRHVNLRAPLFVDVNRRTGAQVVLANPDYPVRFPLPPTAN